MMVNPLAAKCYADEARCEVAEIVHNQSVAEQTFRLRIACPEIAARIRPGQFVMVRLNQFDDPLIGRPLALYDLPQGSAGPLLDVVYLVKGKFTQRLQHFQPGQRVAVWGPLGNGFVPEPCEHLVMVAGGIGQTPFLAVAKERLGKQSFGATPRPQHAVQRITLCYGARRAALHAGVDDFQNAGVDVRLITDDGSSGRRGPVTELLGELLDESSRDNTRILSCGPEPMMAAVAQLAAEAGVPCRVSLETPMACGIGICFTCVAKVRDAQGDWDYKRTCVDGPVFAADQLVWE